MPSTMKLSGLYLAMVAAGSISSSCGKNAEDRKQDHEDQREEALHHGGPAGSKRDRGADPAERNPRQRDQEDHHDGARNALLDLPRRRSAR